ncbi:MAG: hypothetical protein DWI00_17690 [Planctomycetota bacterium]|nr:MAG: hypothetical protein DWI00_17690 [Planctomycetota bacterium]
MDSLQQQTSEQVYESRLPQCLYFRLLTGDCPEEILPSRLMLTRQCLCGSLSCDRALMSVFVNQTLMS